MARMKELDEENMRLKRMYAEKGMQNDLLTEVLGKKVVRWSQRSEMAEWAVRHRSASIALASAGHSA